MGVPPLQCRGAVTDNNSCIATMIDGWAQVFSQKSRERFQVKLVQKQGSILTWTGAADWLLIRETGVSGRSASVSNRIMKSAQSPAITMSLIRSEGKIVHDQLRKSLD